MHMNVSKSTGEDQNLFFSKNILSQCYKFYWHLVTSYFLTSMILKNYLRGKLIFYYF